MRNLRKGMQIRRNARRSYHALEQGRKNSARQLSNALPRLQLAKRGAVSLLLIKAHLLRTAPMRSRVPPAKRAYPSTCTPLPGCGTTLCICSHRTTLCICSHPCPKAAPPLPRSKPFCARRRLVRRRRRDKGLRGANSKTGETTTQKYFKSRKISRARVLQKIERKKIQKILQSANNFPLCAVVLV